jgi:hypothetical protein
VTVPNGRDVGRGFGPREFRKKRECETKGCC